MKDIILCDGCTNTPQLKRKMINPPQPGGPASHKHVVVKKTCE